MIRDLEFEPGGDGEMKISDARAWLSSVLRHLRGF